MKAFKYSLLVFFSILILSCGDSDDCTQLDWVGTYTGTAICDGVETTANVTISASGTDEIIIQYSLPTVTTTFDPITFNACSADRSGSSGGITASVDASLDGDDFTLTEIISGGGFDSNCVVNATRN